MTSPPPLYAVSRAGPFEMVLLSLPASDFAKGEAEEERALSMFCVVSVLSLDSTGRMDGGALAPGAADFLLLLVRLVSKIDDRGRSAKRETRAEEKLPRVEISQEELRERPF